MPKGGRPRQLSHYPVHLAMVTKFWQFREWYFGFEKKSVTNQKAISSASLKQTNRCQGWPPSASWASPPSRTHCLVSVLASPKVSKMADSKEWISPKRHCCLVLGPKRGHIGKKFRVNQWPFIGETLLFRSSKQLHSLGIRRLSWHVVALQGPSTSPIIILASGTTYSEEWKSAFGLVSNSVFLYNCRVQLRGGPEPERQPGRSQPAPSRSGPG